MRLFLILFCSIILQSSLLAQAQKITYESKCPERTSICEDLIIELLKRAIITKENQKLYERLKKPSFIFAAGNKISEDYQEYFFEEDIPFITSQFQQPVMRYLKNKHFDKNDNIKLTSNDVVNRLSGEVIFAYLPIFSADMRRSIVYYETWSRNMVGELEGQAIYKVFQYDDEGDEHILQAKFAIE